MINLELWGDFYTMMRAPACMIATIIYFIEESDDNCTVRCPQLCTVRAALMRVCTYYIKASSLSSFCLCRTVCCCRLCIHACTVPVSAAAACSVSYLAQRCCVLYIFLVLVPQSYTACAVYTVLCAAALHVWSVLYSRVPRG